MEAIKKKIFSYFMVAMLVAVIVIPRVVLLQNGLDHQRIWDTNTPDAFRLLESIQKNDIKDFYFHDHKYPLLGAYFYIPTIVSYYEIGKIFDKYQSPQDFIRKYATDETNLFFWIRLESVLVNILVLIFLYFLTYKFTNNSKTAGFYAILFAAFNFIITLFSVTPRIHNYVFASTVMALFFSFNLVKNKNVSNYLLAFGASAISASISQSGFVNFILPVLAHFYDNTENKWNLFNYRFYFTTYFIAGIFFGLFLTLLFGYPHILLSIFNLADGIFGALLSNEHATPSFGVNNLFSFVKNHFLNTGMFFGWEMIIFLYYCWSCRKLKLFNFEIYDILSFVQILFFLIMFGTAEMVTERFILVILPAAFFIFSRILVKLHHKRWVIYSMAIVLSLQGYGLIQLTRIAINGDTREQALEYILQHTNGKDKILGSIDGNILGIIQTPESLAFFENNNTGIKNQLISNQNISNAKSRDYFYWDTKKKKIIDFDLSVFSYIVLSSDSVDNVQNIEQELFGRGYIFVKNFSAKRNEIYSREFIPWDIITPPPKILLPLKLREFRAIGQSIFIYKRD